MNLNFYTKSQIWKHVNSRNTEIGFLSIIWLPRGQRIRTVRNIKIEDINIDEQYVILKATKDKRQVLLPLSPALCVILHQYLRVRSGKKDDYLFCTRHNKQFTTSGLETAIERYNRSRGVLKTSAHLFRNRFCLWLAKKPAVLKKNCKNYYVTKQWQWQKNT